MRNYKKQIKFNLRFPGQRYDKENGLYHNGFRDYHPGIGRYIQSDPIGLVAGWNTYSYVGSNPLAYLDIFGLSQVELQFHKVALGFYHGKIVIQFDENNDK